MATSTRPGDVLAGRYRLIDLLTESGGGRFWRAHDHVLERFVALHVIPEDDPRAPGLLAAARESATVLDSRILRVLDAEMSDGRCFVVNEWGTGASLDILVTHGGPLGPRRSAWLAAEVAGAMAAAHSRGVAHGRLNPENVLVDRLGAVRLIGLCVDAALHGLPPGRIDQDRHDIGGILYCSLTATWPGPSASIVPGAPHEHDAVIAPRRVRAGVPRPLDQLWTEIEDAHHPRRLWLAPHHDVDVRTAAAVRERLMEFLGGDPTGLPEALAGTIPPINEIRPVVLPQVPEMTPHDFARASAPEQSAPPPPPPPPGALPSVAPSVASPPPPTPASLASVRENAAEDPTPPPLTTSVTVPAEDPPIPSVADLVDMPTEAGMPVFGDDDEEVSWLRARATPPPPPPPFDAPPERPLFAPGSESSSERRARVLVPPPPTGDGAVAAAGYWPWDTGTGTHGSVDTTAETAAVPGRSWLRLAMVVAVALAIVVGVAVAFNLGRGRTPLGAERDEPSATPSLTTPAEPTASPLPDVVAGAFDPLGTDDGQENDDAVALAVDGDPGTSWSTSTYRDQLGTAVPALKSGVGLYLDLGVVREVSAVDLALVGSPAEVELFVSDEAPTGAPTGRPVASDVTAGDALTLEPVSGDGAGSAVTGRYVLVWFTSLPVVSDGFRAGLAEVVVRGR